MRLFPRRRRTSSPAAPATSFIETLESRRLLSAEITITDASGDANDKSVRIADTLVGSQRDQHFFTLKNDGDTDLEITGMDIAGANAGDFTIETYNEGEQLLPGPNFTVAAGASIFVFPTFKPTVAGERAATVTFATNDATDGEDAITLTLLGKGTTPPPTPTAPSNVLVEAVSSSRISISWTDNANSEDGYHVYRASAANGPYSLIATLDANANGYIKDGLKAFTTYYFRVAAFNEAGDSGTSQDFDTTDAPVEAKSNNTIGTAVNMNTLTAARAFNDFVGSTDTRDYYKFKVTATTTVGISASGLGDTAGLTLYKLAGTKATAITSDREGADPGFAVINKRLTAGTYLIRVANYQDSETNYRLFVAPDAAGATRTAARDLGVPAATAKAVRDASGVSDTDDFYKFTLNGTRTVKINLTQFKADCDLELLDSTGTKIDASEEEDLTAETLTKRLVKGTYYIRVFAFEPVTDTSYRLSLGL